MPEIATFFVIFPDFQKICKINLFFGYDVIIKIEIIQGSIKIKKSFKINKLESCPKSQSKNYDELKKYPDLKKNFEKIASKIK